MVHGFYSYRDRMLNSPHPATATWYKETIKSAAIWSCTMDSQYLHHIALDPELVLPLQLSCFCLYIFEHIVETIFQFLHVLFIWKSWRSWLWRDLNGLVSTEARGGWFSSLTEATKLLPWSNFSKTAKRKSVKGQAVVHDVLTCELHLTVHLMCCVKAMWQPCFWLSHHKTP